MIRPALMRACLDALESHQYLSQEDFMLTEYANKSNEPCLAIKWRFDETMFFNFYIPSSKRAKSNNQSYEGYWFRCTMRPGRESVEETLDLDGRSELINELKQWTARLYEDVVSTPAIRQFQEHAAALDEIKVRLSVLPDEPLSREDVAQFSDSLDKLKTELSEQLKRETEDKEQLKRRVEELHLDIEFLKQTLESMSKRQWGELLATKVQRWKSRFSLRQLSAGARVLKVLLPAEVASSLDVIATAVDGVSDVMDKSRKPPESG